MGMNMESVTALKEQAYRKISALSARNVRLLIALADEMKHQEESGERNDVPGEERQRLFREMLLMRSRHKFPADFDYQKTLEDALEEKYGRLA